MAKDILLIVVLLIGGLALVLAEICTPAFGMLAVGALVCFGVMVYKCFQVPPQPWVGFASILVLLLGLPAYLVWLVRLFPRTPLGRRLMMRKIEPDTGGGVPESRTLKDLLGAEGVATGPLRPSGTVEIDGRRIVASAESGLIAAGTRVKVVKAGGMNVVVRALEEPAKTE